MHKLRASISTHPATVVDARSDLPDKGRGANEEKDDGEEAREVEDCRHFLLSFNNKIVVLSFRFARRSNSRDMNGSLSTSCYRPLAYLSVVENAF